MKTPYKVLCVCLGNICRSPTAEVVFRHHCDAHGLNVIVDSAGTSNYHPNKAPDRRSQQHASQRGYDLSALRARQMILTDFIEFDLILAMDHEITMIFNRSCLKLSLSSVRIKFVPKLL